MKQDGITEFVLRNISGFLRKMSPFCICVEISSQEESKLCASRTNTAGPTQKENYSITIVGV